MIVDSPALVAIALGEPDATALLATLERAETNRISAANMLETWMVLDRRGIPEEIPVLDDTIRWTALVVEPVTVEQLELARDAWRHYGKGSSHPAQLNFGDLFAYALAKHLNEPLLFVGDDFSRTNIQAAMATG